MGDMESTKYIYWRDNNQWLGYLQDYPDYWTQAESLEELQAHLRDLHRDLTSGEIPGICKLAELTLSVGECYNNVRNFSTVRSAWRMIARSVPRSSSL
jgi:hypothetical protein